MTPGQSFQRLLDCLIRTGSVAVACTCAIVLTGWLLTVPVLTRLAPGLASMKFNTAVGLLAAAAAIWLLHTGAGATRWRLLARVIGVLITALGTLTLAQDLFGLQLGIDQLILPDFPSAAHTVHPGRMSPGAAFSLTFLGLALLAIKARRASIAAWAHWLVVPALLAATLAIIGYAYEVSALYEVKTYSSMAPQTAVCLLILGLCVLAADSTYGFAGIATSDSAGGMVSRRLLPTIPVMIFLLGWARLEGQNLGLYDTRFGLALLVLLCTSVCLIAVASTAITLHKVDQTRKLGEAEIRSLNAGLELRVEQRTQELARVSSQLRRVNGALELLSQQDSLTGLANRRYFDSYLAEQIAIARRYGRTLTLILCDVDFFKAYNDHYGHQPGDECLKKVAGALRSCCRRAADMAARYGGEEFALILPETGLSDGSRIAEAARDAVAQLQIAHRHSPVGSHVSISGGIAVLRPEDDIDAGQLTLRADQGLFEAKRLGRNRMVVADEAMSGERLTGAAIDSTTVAVALLAADEASS